MLGANCLLQLMILPPPLLPPLPLLLLLPLHSPPLRLATVAAASAMVLEGGERA